MTNTAWETGWARLVACCRDRELSPDMRSIRAKTYRETLNFLTDEQWRHAVEVCATGEWFPAIENLRRVASELPARSDGAQWQIEDTDGHGRMGNTPAERRGIALAGLALIRAELPKCGVIVRPGPREPGEDGWSRALPIPAPPTVQASREPGEEG